tara:strand:- start:8358 stop:9089 length:732 start_codon:yes stop_codon:yes gene_type:complete
MVNSVQVKRSVSPTLHPANITSLPGFEGDRGYVQHSADALNMVYQSIEHVREARVKLSHDESRTPKARVLMAAQMADSYLGKIQKTMEASWGKLSSAIDYTEAALSKPMEEYAGIGNVATEIRAHLKSMTPSKRVEFLADAFERADEKTLKSVLGAPSYLSGMSDIEQQHMTRNYHKRNNPELASRLELMKSVRGKLEQVKPIIFKEFESAVGASGFEIEKLKATSSSVEAAIVLREFAPSHD